MYQNYQNDQKDQISELKPIIMITKQKISLRKNNFQTLDFCNQQYELPQILVKKFGQRKQYSQLNQDFEQQNLNKINKKRTQSKRNSEYLSLKQTQKSNRYQSLDVLQQSHQIDQIDYQHKGTKNSIRKRSIRIKSEIQSYEQLKNPKLIRKGRGKINQHFMLKYPFTQKNKKQLYNYTKKDLQGKEIYQIVLLNFRIKEWIKKINSFINDKIQQEDTSQLIPKISENNDQIIKILERYKNDNIDIINKICQESNLLIGEQGQLKEEYYQILLQKQIERQKKLIQEEYKSILKVRRQIVINGTRIEEFDLTYILKKLEKYQQKFVKMRKLEDKNEQLLLKLNQKLIKLKKNTSQVEQRINNLNDVLKQNIITIEQKDRCSKFNKLSEKKQIIQKQIMKLKQKKQKQLLNIRKQNNGFLFQLQKYHKYYEDFDIKIEKTKNAFISQNLDQRNQKKIEYSQNQSLSTNQNNTEKSVQIKVLQKKILKIITQKDCQIEK